MATVTLPRLPPELISEITPYLIKGRIGSYSSNLYGLYGLRLTCRELYTKSLFDFGHAAFSTLIVDCSLASLDRLYAISQHPHFCKAVKSIYFAHNLAHPVRLEILYEEPDTPLKERVQWILEQGFNRIFASLTNLKKVVIITPFAACFSQFWQTSTNHEGDNQPTPTFSSEKWIVTANMLYRMLVQGPGLPSLESISLFPPYEFLRNRNYIRDAYAVCKHSLAQKHKALKHVREFRIAIDIEDSECSCGERPAQPQGEDESLGVPLYLTLTNMPHLTVLELGPLDMRRRECILSAKFLHQSLTLAHFPRLKVFGLMGASVEQEILVSFLLKHRETLKALSLRWVTLQAGGTWQSVVASLLNYCAETLEELALSWLYEVDAPFESPRTRQMWQSPVQKPHVKETLHIMLLGG